MLPSIMALAALLSAPSAALTPPVGWHTVDPTTLVMPTTRAPLAWQYLSARSVSWVSPDCETKKQTSSLKTGVPRSLKSEACSTITGSCVSSSRICL